MFDPLTDTLRTSVLPALATAGTEVAGTAQALVALGRAGVVRPVRPDRLVRMAGALGRYGLTLTAGYAAGAARHPDRAAVFDDAGRLTYGELHARTDRLARAFAATGVGPGVRVGVLCRNHRAPVEVTVAAGKIGADVVLLNPGLTAGRLGALAQELAMHTVVADAEYDDVADGLPSDCAHVTAWGARDGSSIEALIEADGPDPLPSRPPTGDTIVLTSGTTGAPKGARRPRPRGLGPVGAVLPALPMRAGATVHIAAPLLHTWGHAALQLAVLHGAAVVLTRRFTPESFLDVVERYRCDTVFAVPVMLSRVLEVPEDPSWSRHRARLVAVSGSALPANLAGEFMDRFGDVLHNLYGSTEVSWASIASPADLRSAPGTAGRAPAGTRLVILDDAGDPAPPGAPGRVFVGNDLPFAGYTRDGADVPRAQLPRWGHLIGTGDVGHLDEDGLLHLTGRFDSMIVSGGENVHPGPVEDLLSGRPELREAAVVGVDDDEYGQRLAAFLVLAPDVAAPEPQAVRDWVRAELGPFSVPRDVHVLDELPRNATGKIVHRLLPVVDRPAADPDRSAE